MKHIQFQKDNIDLTVTIPASKSISNRLLILQKTSDISIEINNLSHADDTILLNDLLQKIENHHSTEPLILQCKNCGTAYRFLCAYLTCKKGNWILDGSPRMQQRPIKALVDTLTNAGAEINYLKKEGFPPLQIIGKELNTNHWEINSFQSSQYVSAIAMILPMIKKDANICFSVDNASLQYIDMTLGVMQNIGLNIIRNNNIIKYIHSSEVKNPISIQVEYDWSAVAIWFVLIALSPLQSTILVNGLQKSTLQADCIIAKWINDFGVETEFLTNGIEITKKRHFQPKKLTLDCANNLDFVPYIAVLCAGLKIHGELKNVENLTIKESNRIESLRIELGKIANIDYVNNNLIISPYKKQFPDTVHFSSHDDHRIAMSLSALACCIENVYLDNEKCVKKSYPDFWEQFN